MKVLQQVAAALLIALLIACTVSAASPETSRNLLTGNFEENFEAHTSWQMVGSVVAVPDKCEFTVSDKGGILVNSLTKDTGVPYLITREQFRDVRVELEFMIPKGSNAGVYLMGRYETQILDSFGKERVGSGDLGGIYQRWDRSLPKEKQWSEGTRPMVNAAKAPGEWQTMEIIFHAPRFAEDGRKLKDATFEKVTINGQLVQERATTTGPTASSPLLGDAATGPIAIQGDHGPIAIRRFVVTPLRSPEAVRIEELDAYWSEVSRAVREGDFPAYEATCHPIGIIVSGNRQTSYPLKQALKRWKPNFDDAKSGRVVTSVDFRFSHRYGDSTTAHETGIFDLMTQEKGGEVVHEYIELEALLTKEDGKWKILMEYQKGKKAKADWEALATGH